jgi:hypothetical protein
MARAGVWLLGSFFVSVIGVGCSLVLDMPDRQLDPDFGDAGPDGGCADYCNQVNANCTGENAVYFNNAICMAACSQLPVGTPGVAENSVACREQQAVYAFSTGEPATSCPPAGPGGGNALPDGGPVCGSNCEGYCSLMKANCGFVFTDAGDFDTDACMAECATVPDLGGFNVSIQKGNSIQCRLYHVCAATQDPAVHCVHAAGNEMCVPGP